MGFDQLGASRENACPRKAPGKDSVGGGRGEASQYLALKSTISECDSVCVSLSSSFLLILCVYLLRDTRLDCLAKKHLAKAICNVKISRFADCVGFVYLV